MEIYCTEKQKFIKQETYLILHSEHGADGFWAAAPLGDEVL